MKKVERSFKTGRITIRIYYMTNEDGRYVPSFTGGVKENYYWIEALEEMDMRDKKKDVVVFGLQFDNFGIAEGTFELLRVLSEAISTDTWEREF